MGIILPFKKGEAPMIVKPEDKEIAKDILIALIENEDLNYEDFPRARNLAELVCEHYKIILSTVANNG